MQAAREMDCVVKLLAICERTGHRRRRRLRPGQRAGAPGDDPAQSHPLGSVREAFNAVFVEAEAAGELMFYGKGAGGDPTASAVLGDVVAVARHRVGGGRGPGESAYADLPVVDMGQALTRYHISLDVADRPGVLAQVAAAFAAHDVSIETVRQQVAADGGRRDRAKPHRRHPHRHGCRAVGHRRRARRARHRRRGHVGHARGGSLSWRTSGAA